MSNRPIPIVATMGIDIGKYSFHVIGFDRRGAIILRQKWSRSQVETRLANMPPCFATAAMCRYSSSVESRCGEKIVTDQFLTFATISAKTGRERVQQHVRQQTAQLTL